MDIRYGGLLSRIETALWRLREYLEEKVDSIPELEEPKLTYDGGAEGSLVLEIRYRRIATPSSFF